MGQYNSRHVIKHVTLKIIDKLIVKHPVDKFCSIESFGVLK